MAGKFLIVCSGSHHRWKFTKAEVDAVQNPGVVGYYHDDKPWIPDHDAVREALPHHWRKAFDRAGPFRWCQWCGNEHPGHVPLTDARGQYITTIYAQPLVNTFAKESDNA